MVMHLFVAKIFALIANGFALTNFVWKIPFPLRVVQSAERAEGICA